MKISEIRIDRTKSLGNYENVKPRVGDPPLSAPPHGGDDASSALPRGADKGCQRHLVSVTPGGAITNREEEEFKPEESKRGACRPDRPRHPERSSGDRDHARDRGDLSTQADPEVNFDAYYRTTFRGRTSQMLPVRPAVSEVK